MPTIGKFLSVFLFYMTVLCNAQNIAFPPPISPNYESLFQNTQPSSLQYSLIELTSSLSFRGKLSNVENTSLHRVFGMNSSMHQFLTYSSNKDTESISTISPTHYADTHNAFFCRLERKINKKFITNVRVRLEGF